MQRDELDKIYDEWKARRAELTEFHGAMGIDVGKPVDEIESSDKPVWSPQNWQRWRELTAREREAWRRYDEARRKDP